MLNPASVNLAAVIADKKENPTPLGSDVDMRRGLSQSAGGTRLEGYCTATKSAKNCKMPFEQPFFGNPRILHGYQKLFISWCAHRASAWF